MLHNVITLNLLLIILSCSACKEAPQKTVKVCVASSTGVAMAAIAECFESETGIKIQLNQASSSTLARQITAGCPCDIFLSANTDWMNTLRKKKGLIGRTSHLLGNQLVVVKPTGSVLLREGPLPIAELTDGYIAMGDPSHVPAGIYAKQSLITLGWFKAIKARIVPMPNVSAALRLVEKREVILGIIYRSDAMSSTRVEIVQTLPVTSHNPIIYPIALLEPSSSDSTLFFDYLSKKSALNIFRSQGFSIIN